MREQKKRGIQRRLQVFKWLPIICGLSIIPLIAVSYLVMYVFGFRSGVVFFFGGVGFLATLTVGAIFLRRRITEGTMISDRRRYVSVVGPRLRVIIYVLIILIILFVLMLAIGMFWIPVIGLFLLATALWIIRFYITQKKWESWER
jgi:Ca2+/Na+ antiporter